MGEALQADVVRWGDGPSLTIHAEMAAKINFAAHQSAFAFLRDLRVSSREPDTSHDNVLVTLTANPAFLKPKSWHLDRIAAMGTVAVKNRDVELDGGFLLDLADSVRGTVTITAEKDGRLLAQETRAVELLAYNEWGGAGYMPDLLAAFSMPNDPAIDRVLRGASLVLRGARKPDGIDGYKAASRQRVWEVASAIYSAVCNLGISYAVPPASFERDGQKIRLPGQVLESRLATCLDTTMLFASALEQAGLNPVVVLPHGHALVGVWLQPEGLTSIVIDEAETLRKRIQLKELVLFETTLAASHPAPPFSRAVAVAVDAIAPEKDERFVAAIDIRRARAHKISPLGRKSAGTGPSSHEEATRVEQVLEEAPALPDFEKDREEDTPETPAGRLERWQRKLLDLSARNPLLNHRPSKTSLRLICPDPALLEDRLAAGIRFQIQAVPKPSADGQDEEVHRQRTGEVITEDYARDALERKQVLVDLSGEELNRRAVEVYRKAQTALQEGGANTLYLAIGFLLWKQDNKDDRRFRAPLILLPVTLERQSVRSGIRMLAHDDEPRFNTTLLEMLRKDFRIDIKELDGALPGDGSGIDVNGIWNRIRRAVKDAPGFEVVEEVVLGHFSFAKYLMWKDLVDRTEALRRSPVVRHLLDTPREPYPSDIAFVDGVDVDRLYGPADLLTPLPADASQMAAIATADRGKDFVVIGPPGTGKSQTISNLIAHLLGKGKSVLFVSEKTAALEVVQRRLREVGLGRFCLELHSSKASKADVLRQLRDAWDHTQEVSPAEWEREAERLKGLRDRLNGVVRRLHLRRRNGLSAHHAMGVKVRDAALAARLSLSWPSADHHDEAGLAAMRDAVAKLRIQAAAVGDVSASPFQLVTQVDWSPQWESLVVERAGRLALGTRELERSWEALLKAVGIAVPGRTMARLDALAEFASVLANCRRAQVSEALAPGGSEWLDELGEAARRLGAYTGAQANLSCVYEPFAWRKLDGDDIASRAQAVEAAWWPKRFFLRRRLIADLKAGGASGTPSASQDAPVLKRLREDGEAIDRLGKQFDRLRLWQGHATDIQAVTTLRELGTRVRSAVGALSADPAALNDMRGKIRLLLQDGDDLLAPEASIGQALQDLQKTHQHFKAACEAFAAVAGETIQEAFARADDLPTVVKAATDTIVSRHAELRDWCSWRRRRTAACDLDLGALVEAVEQGRVPVDEIEQTFEAAYCTWWSAAVIGEDDVLRTFATAEHVDAVAKFRELDTRFQKLTGAHIAARMSGKLPDANDPQRKSSWGILRHEMEKKTRHKPVRQLIQEVPDALVALKPCLMMSPLSVAQYLSADHAHFDVVIFDEASQIPVWDAVGALARARQVVVAGDPKQMPPTNFFARSDDVGDGDGGAADVDLESILDEMLGSSIPQRMLNLHYRSRRESLIAFSNSRYYENSLITFPAPVHPDHGIRLVRPEGFYARGGARHNEGEARAVVAEVVRRLTHADPQVRNESIGVVTFNSEQQSLIENLLDAARGENPELEWAFSREITLEPVFVKNLETVQGDERDVILFSVTYGPDQSDHVTMNFGPLNRSGGERRLNVALTRARAEMVVFSTLDPNRIELSRTQARAVADLKHFLEYAERGPSALGAAIYGSRGDFESPFEAAVARALRQKGWQVHTQIGVSAYRIDLGIVHPDLPGVYLAGVECDGAMYHSSAFARERDKIRHAVLVGLGWTLLRIWSTDWWTNAARSTDVLHQALTARLEAARRQRAETVQDELNAASPEPATRQNEGRVFADRAMPSPPVDVSPLIADSPVASDTHYVLADLPDRHPADADQFHSEAYGKRLTAMIDHVIDMEGPIHEEILLRRIARHHGFQRLGSQIRKTVIEIASRRRGKTQEEVGRFFWRKGTAGARLAPARYEGRDDELNNMDYICKEELRAIASALQIEDPAALAARFGVVRLSQPMRQRLGDILLN